MIRWIRSQYFRWQMRRLAKDLQCCLHGEADARELQEIGRLMQDVGEKHNLQSWSEMGEQIEANAESIILNRGIVFPDR